MFLLDFGSLWLLAYLLVRRLNVIPSAGERTALSLAWALGLKSLVLFCWMAGVGGFPSIPIQTGLSCTGLIFVLTLFRRRSKNLILPSRSPYNLPLYFTAMVSVPGVLFVLSLVFANAFPVTEADGIWYQIKGMVFLHEGDFDSKTIISQFRQYPPFLSLLFAYLMAFDVGKVKIIFPFFYLCLLIIFYYRAYALTESKNIAVAFTLVLGTTPYFWWHSFLPFLDLTTGVLYSIGTLYWFFLIHNMIQQKKVENREPYLCSLAFLSGTLFGLAAWSRLEFILYDAIPLLLLIYAFDRNTTLHKNIKNKILLCFAVPLLFFSSLWFATLLNFDLPLERRVLAVGFAGIGMWLLVFLNLKWDFNLKKGRVIGFGALVAVLYLGLMVAGGPQSVSLGKALLIALIRAISVHAFYLCTLFLGLFLFREKLKTLSQPKKLLGWFLVFYPLVHVLIFSYSEPKWPHVSTYIEALWVHPGHSVNLSDTRGMMAFYPIFIFFVAGLPMIKKGFENE